MPRHSRMDILCKGRCESGLKIYNCHPSTLEVEVEARVDAACPRTAWLTWEQPLENPKQHLKTQKQIKPTTGRIYIDE